MVTPLLTVADVKARGVIPPGISDAAFQALIDGESAYLAAEAGAHCAGDAERLTEEIRADARGRELPLDRPARLVDKVRQISGAVADWPVVPASSYRISPDGYSLLRTDGGRWIGDFEVTYGPVQDTDQRRNVVVDLIKTTLAYDGVSSITQPGYTAAWMDVRQHLTSRVVRRRVV